MTAVRETLEDTKMKHEVGYGAMEDITKPETSKTMTPTRTTYGILLLVIKVVLIMGAGATARSYLRDATASIVMSSERDNHHTMSMPGVVEEHPSLSDLEHAAFLADITADAAEVVFRKASGALSNAEAAVNQAQVIAPGTLTAELLAMTAAENGGECHHLARGFVRCSNTGWVSCKSPKRCCTVPMTNYCFCC